MKKKPTMKNYSLWSIQDLDNVDPVFSLVDNCSAYNLVEAEEIFQRSVTNPHGDYLITQTK